MLHSLTLNSVSMTFPALTRSGSVWKTLFSHANDSSKLVFNKLTIKIEAGDKVAITGENGHGKTTLLKLIAGILQPSSGSICLDGIPTHTLPRRLFGISFTNRLLYSSLTGRQNLSYSASLLDKGLSQRDLSEHAHEWGLTPLLDTLVEAYSEGQRTLLALARATLGAPPILLLDEPTAFLDETNTQRVATFLDKSAGTILYTAHALSTMLPSTQVIRL